MKRRFALLLALIMAFSCVSAFAEEAAPESALPQVGSVVHGFEAVEVTNFPLINADIVYFVHQKTGAELLYLANDDTNRVFELTFKTPAESDMGVPHVFEHATLGGSEKYPSKELFFNLSYQTYNTYMNAATYSHMTTYPVASLSEDQLYQYADFYTDSCFHPMLHTDESIFTEEALRYSMDSAESDLTITGTVYSEMQGAYTIASAAYQNWAKTMFPGSTAANSSGGVPSEIPNMTWDDAKAFHDAYYHPSNSLACLYGSFENYERFLALLDGYYSAYEKEEIVIADANYAHISGDITTAFQYPVEASSNTAKGSRVYHGFRVDDANPATVDALDMLTTLLGTSSFPVIQALKEALPAATCSCSITLDTPVPAIVFYAESIDEAEAEIFRATIDAALAELLTTGLDKEAVDAVVAAFRMDIMLVSESATLGVDTIPNIAYYRASTGDWHGYVNYIAALAEKKASMTEEEIAKIVADTQALAQQTESLPRLRALRLRKRPDAAHGRHDLRR